MHRTISRLVPLACCLIGACSSSESPQTTEPLLTFDPAPVVTATSARNVTVTWSSLTEGEVAIERQDDPSSPWKQVARRPAANKRFLDVSLAPSASYRYRVRRCSGGTCSEPVELPAVQTRPSKIAGVDITVPASSDDGSVFVFGAVSIDDKLIDDGRLLAVDRKGNILWECESARGGMFTEVEAFSEHTLTAIELASLQTIELDGTASRISPMLAHHSVRKLADGRLAYLVFDPFVGAFEGNPEYRFLGDGIVIQNKDTATPDWLWRARDAIALTDNDPVEMHEDFFSLGFDWTHGNSITIDEPNQKIYANLRNLNRIYKIDIATKRTDWVMGDGGDFGQGLWSHSHDPQFLSEHRVLMFDNGLRRPAPAGSPSAGQRCGDAGSTAPCYSRAVEIEFDPVKKSAEIVWEYRESPDFYAFAFGGAHRLDNGETFISDGTNGRIVQVAADKTKTWEMRLRGGVGLYKAVKLPRSFFTEW